MLVWHCKFLSNVVRSGKDWDAKRCKGWKFDYSNKEMENKTTRYGPSFINRLPFSRFHCSDCTETLNAKGLEREMHEARDFLPEMI